MKIGIIGCGSIACNQHIPAYLANEKAEIKYFCDPIPGRAQAVSEKFGCGIPVEDFRQVLADPEVDAVSVCTPNRMHSEIAIAAMRAGKHVLCEKPAARTYEEALEMQRVQHETGKVLNIGVVNRFNANVARIRELIASGELGEVYQVYVSFRSHRSIPGLGGAFTTKSIAGGGVMIDWGIHFFDIVMFCCGDPQVKSVSAETFSKLGSPIEDYTFVKMWAGPPKTDGIYDVEEGVTGLIRTSGPTVTFNGAWAQNIAEREMYIDFMGTLGGIRLQYGKDFTLYSCRDHALTTTPFHVDGTPMFQQEINAFVDCIESGEKIQSHIDTNIITAQLMDAVYRSAEEHREIVL